MCALTRPWADGPQLHRNSWYIFIPNETVSRRSSKYCKYEYGSDSHAGVRFGPVRHPFWVNLELDLRFGSAFFLNLNLKWVQVRFRSSSGLNQVQQNLLALLWNKWVYCWIRDSFRQKNWSKSDLIFSKSNNCMDLWCVSPKSSLFWVVKSIECIQWVVTIILDFVLNFYSMLTDVWDRCGTCATYAWCVKCWPTQCLIRQIFVTLGGLPSKSNQLSSHHYKCLAYAYQHSQNHSISHPFLKTRVRGPVRVQVGSHTRWTMNLRISSVHKSCGPEPEL